jgi:ribosomal protein S18 acetylase RimI-like enzyme
VIVEQLTSRDRAPAATLWSVVGLTRPWNDPLEDFDRALSGATSTVLGLRDGTQLVGTAMVGHDGHRGWVYYLAVAPVYQGHGLGSLLMSAAEDWLRDNGAVKIQVMVRHSNQEVISFYESRGYEDSDVSVFARWLEEAPRVIGPTRTR